MSGLPRGLRGLTPPLALLYLLLPGHPLTWLAGLPLNPLGLALLVLVGLLCWAASPWRADWRRNAWLGRLGLLVAALGLLKLGLAAGAPVYGLEASYNGKPDDRRPPERSTDFRDLETTRLDRRLSFSGDQFPLYFFNDNQRFNYYLPDQPDRASLPFVVRWRGVLEVPESGDYRFWLSAAGTARLQVDQVSLALESRERSETVSRAVRLEAGSRPIELHYARPAGGPAELLVEWDQGGSPTPLAEPYLLAGPSSLPAALRERLVWLARAVDGAYLAALAGLTLVLARAVAAARDHRLPRADRGEPEWPPTAGYEHAAAGAAFEARRDGAPSGGAAPRQRGWERPLLALLLAAIFGYAALSSLDLRQRVVLLEGGADWLTYETYARDILLNGPLMTLGREPGKGRPFFFQPFYPYALALGHWLTGEDLYGVVVLQLFGIGVGGVLVYYLGRCLFGWPAGLAALGLVIGLLFPLQFDWVARRLLSENIYFWLLPAAALAFVELGARPTWRLALLAGALLGLCCMTRGPTLLWVPPVLAITWSRLGSRAARSQAGAGQTPSSQPAARPLSGLTRSARVRYTLLAAAACGLVVGLVPLRNVVVARQFALVATNGMATMELAHPLTERVNLAGAERNPLYRALDLDESVIRYAEFLRQDPLGYAATLPPLGLYALGLPGLLEPDSALRWELLGLVGLYLVYLARAGPGGWRRERARLPATWLLHSFIWLHFAVMMIFLPNVYGYRQVLPMYLLLAVFGGQVLAGAVLWGGRRLGRAAPEQGQRPADRRQVEQYVPGAGATPGHEELA